MQILLRLIYKMEKIKPKIVPKVWGFEEIGVSSEKYCGKLLHLKKGFRCSIHSHSKDETFRMLAGLMYLELGKDYSNMEGMILKPGDWIRIPSNFWHRFSGLKDSVFAEFSTADCESHRKTESGAIPDFVNWEKKIMEGKNVK